MKNGSTNPRRGNHGGHASTSIAKPNIHGKNLMYLVGSAWSCIMSCSNRTRPLLGLSSEYNWWDWAEHSRKNALTTTPCKIILLHDNAQPHVAAPVKTYLETFKWEILPHPPYSSDIASSDYHLFRSMPVWAALHIIWRYQKLYRWLDSLKRWSVLPTR